MGVLLTALAAGAAVWSLLAVPGAVRRVERIVGRRGGHGGRDPGAADGRLRRSAGHPARSPVPALAVLGAAGALFLLVGGWLGALLAAGAAVALHRFLAGLQPAAVRRRSMAVTAALPMAATLLAACLRAGRPVHPSVAAVGEAIGGPLGDDLVHVAASLALGAPPEIAWRRLAAAPATARFARTLVRTWGSGAPLADTLDALAVACRATARAAAEQRAKSVGVRAAAPLGLCFLPAFVAVGLVPVIVGVVTGVIHNLF